MEEMRCTQCGAVSFSAAARTLIQRGERCPQCGGEVTLADDDAAVGVLPDGEQRPSGGEGPGRRFDRD